MTRRRSMFCNRSARPIRQGWFLGWSLGLDLLDDRNCVAVHVPVEDDDPVAVVDLDDLTITAAVPVYRYRRQSPAPLKGSSTDPEFGPRHCLRGELGAVVIGENAVARQQFR